MSLQTVRVRYRYIDYFKAVAIILVILGHINFANEKYKAWIYAFHMPAFFYASGLLLKNSGGGRWTTLRSSSETIWRKTQSIIFPYFVWAIIYASLEPKNIIKIMYGSHNLLKSAGTLTSLWFLTTLFLAHTFFEVARLVFKNRFTLFVQIALMICSFIIAAILPNFKYGYPWNLNVSFCAFGFLMLGNISFPMVQMFHQKMHSIKKRSGVIICSTASLLAFAGTLLYRFNLPDNSTVINTSNAIYGFFPMFLFIAIIGISLIVFISILLDLVLRKDKKDVLMFVGQNTFCIFAVHKPVTQELFGKVFSIITMPVPVILFVTLAGTLIISCMLTLFINRYLPLLAGKVSK